MNNKGLSGLLIAEVFGTFILILLGDGVVANVGLAPRLDSGGYNWITIAIGWAFAVIIAVFVVGGVSGAHINPAVTVAMVIDRRTEVGVAFGYIVAQVAGARPATSGTCTWRRPICIGSMLFITMPRYLP